MLKPPTSLPLVWSAVNISEGRDAQALGQLADQLKGLGRLKLADWSADADHNRSVFSMIGDQHSLREGLLRLFEWAEQHIDLRRHEGHHPRLGAVDVVPFAPLGDTTIEQAKAAALLCARTVAERFALPIFLYRDSSRSSELPITLPFLRRGGLTELARRLADGEIQSDLGPQTPHPSLGVSVFGARPPLVAYNCVLDTDDLGIGRRIAAKVRASAGGPRGLQALAFPLRQRGGAVQISMNLLEPAATPPHLAFLAVAEAAAEFGAVVTSSELIGLVPQEALRAAFAYFLKLDDLRPNQVAEENLMLGREE